MNVGGQKGVSPQKAPQQSEATQSKDQFSKDGKVSWKATGGLATMAKKWLGSTAIGRLFGGGKTLQAEHTKNTMDWMVDKFTHESDKVGTFSKDQARAIIQDVLQNTKEGKKLAGKMKHLQDVSVKDLNAITGAVLEKAKMGRGHSVAFDKLVNDFQHDMLKSGQEDASKLTGDTIAGLVNEALKEHPEINSKIKNLSPGETLSMSESDKIFTAVSKKVNEIKQRQVATNYVERNLTAKGFEGVPGAKTYNVSHAEVKAIVNSLIDNDSALLSIIREGGELNPQQKLGLMNKAVEYLEKTETAPKAAPMQERIASIREEALSVDLKNLAEQYDITKSELKLILAKNEKASGKIMMGEKLSADDIFSLGKDISAFGATKALTPLVGQHFGFDPELGSSPVVFNANDPEQISAIHQAIENHPEIKQIVITSGRSPSVEQLQVIGQEAYEIYDSM